MAVVARVAGINGTFTYSLPVVPFSAPQVTIYSDSSRTQQIVVSTPTVATGVSTVFTASYPASLAAGTYYPTFSTVLANGQPALVDATDTLVLITPASNVDQPSVTPLNYASVADMRAWGIGIQEADDLTISTYATLASRIVDDFCGQTFVSPPSPRTWVVSDVRQPIIPMPRATTNVLAVFINNSTTPLASTGYRLRTDQFGNITALQLYIPGFVDVDGFPNFAYSSVPVWWRAYGSPPGSDVTITATIGYNAVPAEVQEATRKLTARQLRERNVLIPDNRIRARSTENSSTAYEHRFGEGLRSTGDTEVDRILTNAGLVYSNIQVA